MGEGGDIYVHECDWHLIIAFLCWNQVYTSLIQWPPSVPWGYGVVSGLAEQQIFGRTS